MIGWARYEGVGPGVASESALLNETTITSFSASNATARADLGDGGVAGSSVPKQDWLADVDTTSAVFGVLTALGHVLGFAFYVLALCAAVRLFRSQFRSNRLLFRPAARASLALFTWLLGATVAGFYLATQKGFAKAVIAVLNEEGFLCQVYILKKNAIQCVTEWAGRVCFILRFFFFSFFFLRPPSLDISVFFFFDLMRRRVLLSIVFARQSAVLRVAQNRGRKGAERWRAGLSERCSVRHPVLLPGNHSK